MDGRCSTRHKEYKILVAETKTEGRPSRWEDNVKKHDVRTLIGFLKVTMKSGDRLLLTR
jgi:hypothetical protein